MIFSKNWVGVRAVIKKFQVRPFLYFINKLLENCHGRAFSYHALTPSYPPCVHLPTYVFVHVWRSCLTQLFSRTQSPVWLFSTSKRFLFDIRYFDIIDEHRWTTCEVRKGYKTRHPPKGNLRIKNNKTWNWSWNFKIF